MMVVVIIMAVMLAFALPTYKNLVTEYRLSDELTQIQSDVELARSSAVRTGSTVTICPANIASASTATTPACNGNNEWNTGWIVFTDNHNDQKIDAGDVLLHEHLAMTGGDTLVSEVLQGNAPVNTITFNQMGATAAWGGATNDPPNSGVLLLNDSNSDANMTSCLGITETGMVTAYSRQANDQSSCTAD
jgi:type IV fimbrial biogenesis protein FimT